MSCNVSGAQVSHDDQPDLVILVVLLLKTDQPQPKEPQHCKASPNFHQHQDLMLLLFIGCDIYIL